MSMNKRVRKRLRKDRPMSTISIRIPEDVIDDLKLLAPVLGFSGYQPLLRAYVGQGLRRDLAKLETGRGLGRGRTQESRCMRHRRKSTILMPRGACAI